MRRPLTRRLVVDTALDIVDADGLAGLTVRRLGAALGVEGMAVYHHVANKDALLDALVARVLVGEQPVPSVELPWDRRLTILYERFRASVLRHPNLAEVALTRPVRDLESARTVEAMLHAYHDAGLPTAEAVGAYRMVGSYVLGYLGIEVRFRTGRAGELDWDVSAAEFPYLIAAAAHDADLSWDEQFTAGLEMHFAAIRSRTAGR